MWDNIEFEPGEIKVVAFNDDGVPEMEKVVKTAGKPHHIELIASRTMLMADGKDLTYVVAKVVDKEGNLCPHDSRLMTFEVSGAGKYRASANGDPTCLDLFHEPKMHVFNGMLTIVVQSGESAGEILLTAKASGLQHGQVRINVQQL